MQESVREGITRENILKKILRSLKKLKIRYLRVSEMMRQKKMMKIVLRRKNNSKNEKEFHALAEENHLLKHTA